jgi:hypothetical protein
MSTVAIFTVLAPLAFVVGFALQRGNVCSVLAARQIVWSGRFSRARGLLLASAWGFAVLLPLVAFGIGPFKLSQQAMPGLATVLAGVIYAVGCFCCGACIFGVCSRTVSGHISFVFAIPAMAIGATFGQSLGLGPQPAVMTATAAASPGLPLLVLWIATVAWLLWSTARTLVAYARVGVRPGTILKQARWRSALAATVIGILGSLLFATDTAWFYPAAVKRLTLYAAGLSPVFPLDSLVGGGAVFLGGLVAALYKGRVVVRPPHLLASLSAIVGGLVIGFAWAMIPGGNDAMVLYLVPSLALHGIVAYAAMFVTLIGIEWMKRRGSRP